LKIVLQTQITEKVYLRLIKQTWEHDPQKRNQFDFCRNTRILTINKKNTFYLLIEAAY